MGIIITKPSAIPKTNSLDSQLKSEPLIIITDSDNLSNARILSGSQGIYLLDNGPGETVEIRQNMVWSEIPSGISDGNNRIFSLNKTPNPPESLIIYKDGLAMMTGSQYDYVLSGSNIIVFNVLQTPISGSNIFVRYSI